MILGGLDRWKDESEFVLDMEKMSSALEEAMFEKFKRRIEECGRDKLSAEQALGLGREFSEAQRWISVNDRLPRCGERVLVTNDGSVWEAYLSISHKWVRQEFVWAAKVTHWMPLPEPPKEGA